MRKFLAIVKREYRKVVFTWSFLISTLLAPVLAAGFAVVPALIFSIKGEPTRLAIVDQSGQVAERLKVNLSGAKQAEKMREAMEESMKKIDPSSQAQMEQTTRQISASFVIEEVTTQNKTPEETRAELNKRITSDQLDAYLIIPKDFDTEKFDFFARNTSDFILLSRIEDAANEAVREARLAKVNINQTQLNEINKKIAFGSTKISERGEEKDDGNSFWVVFIFAMMIYITLAIYGQAILGAVVEEKETKIAEVLFSSAKPFQLLMGKLIGVGLAGLTQLSIWISSALILAIYGIVQMKAAGMDIKVPAISPLVVVLFFVYFLLGFFTYATIFALIGSMVTTVQEGGQFSMIPILLLLGGLYGSFPVIRDPNSAFAFWASVVPFVSPIVMPVRMIVQMPDAWQILLSIVINVATILFFVWIAARVYRIGMLMYGKKASIPEVWRWIRQA